MTRVAAPFRFLAAILALWTVARVGLLWPSGEAEGDSVGARRAGASGTAPPTILAATTASAGLPEDRPFIHAAAAKRRIGQASPVAEGCRSRGLTVLSVPVIRGAESEKSGQSNLEPQVAEIGLVGAPGEHVGDGRLSGSAWLFVRGGGDGDGLATGSQLGGSQAGARLAWQLHSGRRDGLAVAARFSVPLADRAGAEGAVGIDWRPLAGVPFRLSVERRIGIGARGRDAWSAYGAGGFYRGLPGDGEIEGYAQAGLVGARRRDAFVDGSVRAARRIAAGGGVALIGGGLWGAAQPGAARLDIGPRAAFRLPAGKSGATLISAEWRLRIGGDARPGTGAALTLATDF